MNRFLIAACAAMGIALSLLWLRLDTVALERDNAVTLASQHAAAADSLRGTMRLQRELANDQAARESTFLKEKQRAEDYAESMYRCLADGTCGLRVAATCPAVRVGAAGAVTGEPDAGTPELTAAARRAYPALVAGLKVQRAQILSLQEELVSLHRVCKLAP
ncbi:lysis system i-spanin subunit Rz [Pseudomonas chengduensis]